MRRPAVLLTGGALLLALSGAACRSRTERSLRITVDASGPLPGVTALEITASQKGRLVVKISPAPSGASDAGAPPYIVWPIEIELGTAGLAAGDALIEARAFDATRTEVARGAGSVTIPATSSVRLELVCQSLVCAPAVDAAPADVAPDALADDRPSESPSTCGNGALDGDETCDVAIPSELPGACPQGCDDGIACTVDRLIGRACTAACTHGEITALVATDGCCPAGATRASDPDCSASCGNGRIEAGESCDTGLHDEAGACPSADTCDDGDACTRDQLISAGTCSARCAHDAITAAIPGDGCCPVGADARSDPDCPAACGNGVLEPGEPCDTAIAAGGAAGNAGRPGACPTAASCDDGDSCTTDVIVGSDCQATCRHVKITAPRPADGCCPTNDAGTGPGTNVDPDCPAVCGNGVLERGESCDRGIPDGAPGACPAACPEAPAACLGYRLIGGADLCSARCEVQPVNDCSPVADGCCPTGCGSASDPDCPATCGDGKLDAGELCDVAIADGAGSCPRSCSDGVSCTDDLLIDAGSCSARCAFVPTRTFRNGDGCCPPGAHAGLDSDCPASCGNGVVEAPWETCDVGTMPASCASECPPADSCAPYLTLPSTSACTLPCLRQPITACLSGDGCCPSGAGCTAANDSDCGPRCGNGVVDATETCDRGISAGNDGACPAACADADPCTLDFASGSRESCDRVCTHAPITTCGAGDRCCPAGCTPATDADCITLRCGDGIVQATETCDPPTSCPATCADDGDACTVDQLVGSAITCDAACRHVPILRCSGAAHDGCCPRGCSPASDSDC